MHDWCTVAVAVAVAVAVVVFDHVMTLFSCSSSFFARMVFFLLRNIIAITITSTSTVLIGSGSGNGGTVAFFVCLELERLW